MFCSDFQLERTTPSMMHSTLIQRGLNSNPAGQISSKAVSVGRHVETCTCIPGKNHVPLCPKSTSHRSTPPRASDAGAERTTSCKATNTAFKRLVAEAVRLVTSDVKASTSHASFNYKIGARSCTALSLTSSFIHPCVVELS
jgi:hypothetical protein